MLLFPPITTTSAMEVGVLVPQLGLEKDFRVTAERPQMQEENPCHENGKILLVLEAVAAANLSTAAVLGPSLSTGPWVKAVCHSP